MLEVTAKDEAGKQIFADKHEYQMLGYDVHGNRTVDNWKIRRFDDSNTIRPDILERKSFQLSIPEGIKAANLEASLFYYVTPAAPPVLMAKASRVVELSR